MNDAIIQATNANNDRRMTRNDCELLVDNTAQEFGCTLWIERKRDGYVLKRANYSNMKDGVTGERELIQATSITAMYWALVDMREVWRDFRNNMGA